MESKLSLYRKRKVNKMKKILQKWNSISLILRILCGLIIGVILGLLVPDASVIAILGDIFVGALKAIAPILVFVLVLSALANAQGAVGKRFRTVVILYMVSTLLAALVAVAASYLFPVTINLTDVAAATDRAHAGIGEVLSTLITNMVTNPVSSVANANYIGILTWAIVFGIGLRLYASDRTKEVIQDISNVISAAVRWVINLAPFGILGLSFDSVASNGLGIFKDYGLLLLVLVGAMLFTSFVVNPIIAVFFLHRNPYPLLLRCMKESGLTAFFTRSSAANIPVNMNLCENLGLDKDFYSVSIPLGATINMDGAAVTITVLSLATANTLGIAVDVPTAIVLSIMATLGACGASGVAGGSLLLIPMACSLFGISNDIAMQAVAVGFIIGIIQDSVETALNSSGDAFFTAIAEFNERIKAGKEVKF